MPAVMDGKITAAEARLAFEKEYSTPTRFVPVYFERYEGDRDFHRWIHSFGDSLHRTMMELRQSSDGVENTPHSRKALRFASRAVMPKLTRTLMTFANDELADFGIDKDTADEYFFNDSRLDECPTLRLFRSLFVEYIENNVGLLFKGRVPVRSDGGDLIHSFYVAHCDFWRGDAYFADLVKRHTTPSSATIVARLSELAPLIRLQAGLQENDTLAPKLRRPHPSGGRGANG